MQLGSWKHKIMFNHSDTVKPVCIFLDPCHMFKLGRNSIGDIGKLFDAEGNTVEWKFIDSLHQLQEKEGLHLENKLRTSHIQYKKKKNECEIGSVITECFCCRLFSLNEKIPEFQVSQGTIKFRRTINALFDIKNSRNRCSYGCRCPL